MFCLNHEKTVVNVYEFLVLVERYCCINMQQWVLCNNTIKSMIRMICHISS